MASKTSPATFIRQVRVEMAKVTWPSRRETGVSAVMVFVMVTLACVFFLLADWVMASVIGAGISSLANMFQ